MAGPDTYEVKRLSEIERAFGGAMARVRGALGITAFGVQVVDLPPNSGQLAPEHDHRHDGQEELYPELGGPETLAPTASSALAPDGPPPQLGH